MEENDYETLLEAYTILEKDNEIKKESGIHDYSLMNALLKKTDEVNLHSNFIYSMINPLSSHYCKTIFLEDFLEAINEPNFININNAKVHKEVGKIDLLIEDGEKVIIIENKLKAPDQKHQISRYIKYSIENYLGNSKSKLEDKIHVVYLSEYKAIPNSNSFIGFEELQVGSKQLIWKNETVELINSGKFTLPDNTILHFSRVRHSQELLKWVDLAIEWLEINRPKKASGSIAYAFEEYKLILKRLDIKKQWRNLMGLDDYMIGRNDEEKMYSFMCEAYQKLNDYLGKKLFAAIENNFPERIKIETKNEEFSLLTEDTCIKWFQQWKTKEKYANTGFQCRTKIGRFVFALGISNIAYGEYTNEYSWEIKTNRKNLQNNKGENLFKLIQDLEKYSVL